MAVNKELSLSLKAKDQITRVIKGVGGATKTATNALKDMGSKGKQAIDSLTKRFFFLKEAMGAVAGAARSLFDAFIGRAVTARKHAQSLANVFDEGAYQKIRDFSKETGLAFTSISTAALNMGAKLEQAGGLDKYLDAIKRVATWRPDLGAEGAIAYVDNLLGKIGETTAAGEKGLGQYTSVVVGGVGKKAIDLSKELDKLGVVAKTVDPAATALDRLTAAWDDFATKTGAKVLDKLVEGAEKLLEWLTKNEAKVLSITDKFVKWVNEGFQWLIDWLDSDGPDKLLSTFSKLADTIGRAAKWISPIFQGMGKAAETIKDPFGRGKEGAGRRAIGAAAVRPGKAIEQIAETARLGTAAGAGILGTMFGGRAQGARAAGAVMSVPTAAERRQRVDVHVTVDDSGAIQAYTKKEIGQNNADMVGAWR